MKNRKHIAWFGLGLALFATVAFVLNSLHLNTNQFASAGNNAAWIKDGALLTNTVLRTPTATTPPEDDNDTSVATTAYVQTEIAGLSGGSGTNDNVLVNGANAVNADLTNSTDILWSVTGSGPTKISASVSNAITRDAEIDTPAELEAIWGGLNLILDTEVDTSAELRTLVTDESGTGALIFADGSIGAATATTPAPGDNDTSVATTAFVTAAVAAGGGGGGGSGVPVIVTNSYVSSGTNFSIDATAITNKAVIRVTLTQMSGLLYTNAYDGKDFRLEVAEDNTGTWRLLHNTNILNNIRFSEEITGINIATNANHISALALVCRGTNLWICGNLTKFAP